MRHQIDVIDALTLCSNASPNSACIDHRKKCHDFLTSQQNPTQARCFLMVSPKSSSWNVLEPRLICFNLFIFFTRQSCALDRRTNLSLNVPEFHRQVFKHVKILSQKQQSQKMKEQKKEQRERP